MNAHLNFNMHSHRYANPQTFTDCRASFVLLHNFHHILNIHPKTFQMNGHMTYLPSNNYPYLSNCHKLYGSPSTFQSWATKVHSIA